MLEVTARGLPAFRVQTQMKRPQPDTPAGSLFTQEKPVQFNLSFWPGESFTPTQMLRAPRSIS